LPIKEPFETNNIVIAIDGTSASGKSTNAKLVARALGYIYVDTGAMYRTLAWYCLQKEVDVAMNPKPWPPCAADGRPRWNAWTTARCACWWTAIIRKRKSAPPEVSEAVPHVAAVPKVRRWMKEKQRECLRFGNLVMEGRDIGTNVFPETEFKFYLDASLDERAKRRAAEGVQENLAARDQRDSQRAAAPLDDRR
jgi:CMP/dCMP kinase